MTGASEDGLFLLTAQTNGRRDGEVAESDE